MRIAQKTGNARIDSALQAIARDLPRMVSCGRVDVTAAGPVVIRHTLNAKPEFFFALRWAASIDITATEADQKMWTKRQIVVTASAAGTITLFVGATD